MMDGIPIGDLTAPTLLGMFVLMVFLGLLIPRYIYKEKVEEAKIWREAYYTERLARSTTDAQTAELLELAKTTQKIIEAGFSAKDSERQSGGSDVVPTAR